MFRFILAILFSLSFSQLLFISEYSEGSGYNKYIEIYNPSSGPVDLSSYQVWKISNGGDWEEGSGNALTLSGSLASNDVYVICHSGQTNNPTDPTVLDLCDLASSESALNFNGDDAIGLAYNNEIIDQVGDAGDDPGSGWEVAGESDATKDHTIVRKAEYLTGNTNWALSAGTSSSDSEWEVYSQNEWAFLGWHISGGNVVTGCTDPNATNYNPDATANDGSCEYSFTALTIAEIQGQSEASPYVGQIVSATGVVTGVASYGFFMQDQPAPWSAIWVYGGAAGLLLGDQVTVSGEVKEYTTGSGTITEIEAMGVELLSSGNSLPEPIVLNSGDVDESYESVLLSVTGQCVSEPDNYGAWQLDDGSGALYVDDKLFSEGDELVEVGLQYTIVGPLDFSYGDFELVPRSESDIILYVEEGVPVANAGENQSVDFGDTVILDGTSSYDTDNGTILGYSWIQESGPVVDIDNYEQATISFTAPNEFCELEFSLEVFDNQFNFSSKDYITISVGTLGIYDIQFTEEQGEYCYETVSSGLDVTVDGIVTHVRPDGQFFLQDYDYDLWSGIYVYDTTVQPSLGDELSVSASVNEYYSLTQLLDVTSSNLISSGNEVTSTLVDASDIGIECSLSGEMYESMLVEMRDITFESVDEYGNWTISDDSGNTMVDDYYFDSSLGDFPAISEGDQYSCLKGVVSYSYNEFKVYPRNVHDFSCDAGVCLAGDVNGDEQIDVLDVVSIVQFVLGNTDSIACADFNDDGTVDVLDIVAMVNLILN